MITKEVVKGAAYIVKSPDVCRVSYVRDGETVPMFEFGPGKSALFCAPEDKLVLSSDKATVEAYEEKAE